MCFLRDLLLLGSLHDLTFKYLYLAHNRGHFNFFPFQRGVNTDSGSISKEASFEGISQ